MLRLERFENELMESNCYVLYDTNSYSCIVVDPGSEKSEKEIRFISEHMLTLDYIILTHEHTDHTWGVNALLEKFNPKVVCSNQCSINLNKESNAYFRYYYDDPNYQYVVKKVDVCIEGAFSKLTWSGRSILFLLTPGHSSGSMCFSADSYLFTGDTLMKYKPYISKRNGSLEEYEKSVRLLKEKFEGQRMLVCPGHGDSFICKHSI